MLKLSMAVALVAVSCSDPTGVSAHLRDRWFQSQQDASYSRPVAAGDLVIFGTGDGKLVGRSKADGAAVWTSNAGQPVVGGRLVVRSGVVIASLLQTTVGVNAGNGAILWYYAAPKDTI